MDRNLRSILLDDEFAIINVPVVEASGSTEQRLRVIKNAMR
jgi:hypothetical protein